MSVCKRTRIYYLWQSNLKSEADNHLIKLAIAGNAKIIATKLNLMQKPGFELWQQQEVNQQVWL